jgi:hypothetical protein
MHELLRLARAIRHRLGVGLLVAALILILSSIFG